MKKLLLLLLHTSLALCLAGCGAGQEGTPNKGDTLSGLAGGWVLVNYWAQWCAPCIEEIPELNAFDAQRADVTVVGVNYDGASGEALRQQEEKLGVDFPTLATDPAVALDIPRPRVLPTTLLVDPRGQVVDTLVGPQTEQTLTARLTLALGGDAARSGTASED